MKKMLCLLLALALCLCGCTTAKPIDTTAEKADQTTAGNSSQTTAGSSDTDATELDETEPSDTIQLSLSAISLPILEKEIKAEDGTVLMIHSYQDVALIAPDAEMAEKIVLKLLQEIDNGNSLSEETLEFAKEDYGTREDWLPYFYQLLYIPERIDEKVLSLHGIEASYSGGVHPNQIDLSVNFDMVTGEILTLEDILTGADAATELSQMIIADLTENKEYYQLYEGYASVINNRYGGGSDEWKTNTFWYLSGTGLCVTFSPYDLAPYVVGPIQVVIPYSDLTGILKDDFVLPQLPEANGTVSIALAQDVDLEQYSQFAEAILDPDGERFILYTDDLVTDVRLQYGNRFDTVFASNTLCASDAIMVQAMIPDTIPNLRMSYVSGGVTHIYEITQSGMDGSMLLLEVE